MYGCRRGRQIARCLLENLAPAIAAPAQIHQPLVVLPRGLVLPGPLGRLPGARVAVEAVGERLQRLFVLDERFRRTVEIHEEVTELLARRQDLPRGHRMGTRPVLERRRFAQQA